MDHTTSPLDQVVHALGQSGSAYPGTMAENYAVDNSYSQMQQHLQSQLLQQMNPQQMFMKTQYMQPYQSMFMNQQLPGVNMMPAGMSFQQQNRASTAAKPSGPRDLAEAFTRYLPKKAKKELYLALKSENKTFNAAIDELTADEGVKKLLKRTGKKKILEQLKEYVKDPAADGIDALKSVTKDQKQAFKLRLETKPFKEAIYESEVFNDAVKQTLLHLGRNWIVETGFGGNLQLFTGKRARAEAAEETPEGQAPVKAAKVEKDTSAASKASAAAVPPVEQVHAEDTSKDVGKKAFEAMSEAMKVAVRDALTTKEFKKGIDSIGLEAAEAQAFLLAGRKKMKHLLEFHFEEPIELYVKPKQKPGIRKKSLEAYALLTPDMKLFIKDQVQQYPYRLAIDNFKKKWNPQIEQLHQTQFNFCLREDMMQMLRAEFPTDGFVEKSEDELRQSVLEELKPTLTHETLMKLKCQMQKCKKFFEAVEAVGEGEEITQQLKSVGETKLRSLIEAELDDVVLTPRDTLLLIFAKLSVNRRGEWRKIFQEHSYEDAVHKFKMIGEVSEAESVRLRALGWRNAKDVLETWYQDRVYFANFEVEGKNEGKNEETSEEPN